MKIYIKKSEKKIYTRGGGPNQNPKKRRKT